MPTEPDAPDIRNVGIPEFHWYRGPSAIEDGFVTLDIDKAEHYDIRGADLQVAFDLANIETDDDIAAFTRKWGLLWHGVGAPEFREPLSHWYQAARVMGYMVKLATLLKLAGDTSGPRLHEHLERLRDYVTREQPAIDPDGALITEPETLSDRELMDTVSEIVQAFVNRAAVNVRWSVFDRGYGDFAQVLAAPDVYNAAVLQIGMMLVGPAGAAICEGCGRAFNPERRQQRYHSATCSDRARYRRWKERQKTA
jgi:hypothetical protein